MYKHVLLPLDGSSLAEQVLPHLCAVAKRLGAESILLEQNARRRLAVEALALPEKTIVCMTRQPDRDRVQPRPYQRELGGMDRRRP